MKKLMGSLMAFLPASACAQALRTATVSGYVSESYVSGSPFALSGMAWIVIVVVALIAAFLVVTVLRAELKTASKVSGAANYIQEGSLNLRVDQDHFLYRSETRRKIEQPKEGK